MNDEVVKAMNRKPKVKKESAFQKWWNKNGYKVLRVVFFPVWFAILAYRKIDDWRYKRNAWSEERANEILSYYVPRRAYWSAEKKTLGFFDNGYGWSMCYAKKHLKIKDRYFWYIHCGFFGGEMRDYLIEKFELDGFKKIIKDTYDGWTDIDFQLIEKGD